MTEKPSGVSEAHVQVIEQLITFTRFDAVHDPDARRGSRVRSIAKSNTVVDSETF